MDPLISIIIPTHNRSLELTRALTSVISQDYPHWEALVCDDASTEDLQLVISSFQNTRIRLVRNDQKSNANVMRNRGLMAATGAYIAFLDSDDEWLPNHLSSHLQWLQKSNAQGVYGSAIIQNGESEKYVTSRDIPANTHGAEFLLNGGVAPIPSWLLMGDCAKSIRFDESLKRHQDYAYFSAFSEKFTWKACPHATLIIHWSKGEKRQRDPTSERAFIQRYRAHIKPKTWMKYHLDHFGLYQQEGFDSQTLAYYRGEAKRFAHLLSFADYCSLYPHRNGWLGFLSNFIGFCSNLLLQKSRS